MNSSLNIFVPIYNEIESSVKIEENIRRTLKVFPGSKFFFCDNASTDGTTNFLLGLRNKYPDNVSLAINSENIGFQKNLAKISELPSDRMILILGANDQVYTPGLRKLRSILETGEYDLVVCNTCYVTDVGRVRLQANEEEKVLIPFVTTTLDGYFRNNGAIPNGIMQFVIHPRHCYLFSIHESWMSPQVGVFFDIFPGRVGYLPPPPVALVNRTEGSGWRSSKEGILETHMDLARDIIGRAWEIYCKGQMSLVTFTHIRFFYTHAVMCLIYKFLLVRNYWGCWELPVGKRLVFIARIWKELIFLRPLVLVNPLFIAAVSVKFITFKTQSLLKFIMEFVHGQSQSAGRKA